MVARVSANEDVGVIRSGILLEAHCEFRRRRRVLTQILEAGTQLGQALLRVRVKLSGELGRLIRIWKRLRPYRLQYRLYVLRHLVGGLGDAIS